MQKRISQLIQTKETLFHINDLKILWGISNMNTLYTTLKRYFKDKILFRIYKGLYSLVPLEKIDPYLLGMKVIHNYGYISTETVLVKNGIIQQKLYSITLVSNTSKKITIGDIQYIIRKLQDKYLYQDIGIKKENGIYVANTERAIADMLYFNPTMYFDAQNIIEWNKVRKIQKQLSYPLTPKYYDSSKS